MSDTRVGLYRFNSMQRYFSTRIFGLFILVCYITRYMCNALAFINMSSFQCYIMFCFTKIICLTMDLTLLREEQICPYRSECWVDLNVSLIKSWFSIYSNGQIQNTISFTFFIKQFTPSWKKAKKKLYCQRLMSVIAPRSL